jgi:Tfp pilus assembly protein PilO
MIVRPLSTREKRIFFVCLAVIAFYVVYYFGYQGIKEEIKAQQASILQSEKDLRRYAHTVRSEKTIEQRLKSYENLLKQKESDEQEMTKVLSDIEAVADKVSIKIINMEPQKIKRVDFYNYFSVDVQAEGPLKKVCEFLYALESTTNYFYVDELRIEKYAARADTLKCQLVVSRILIF